MTETGTSPPGAQVCLGESVIMLSHLRGIVILDDDGVGETSHRLVSYQKASSVRGALKPETLSFIAGQFNSVCTKRIWASGRQDFAWQPTTCRGSTVSGARAAIAKPN